MLRTCRLEVQGQILEAFRQIRNASERLRAVLEARHDELDAEEALDQILAALPAWDAVCAERDAWDCLLHGDPPTAERGDCTRPVVW